MPTEKKGFFANILYLDVRDILPSFVDIMNIEFVLVNRIYYTDIFFVVS